MRYLSLLRRLMIALTCGSLIPGAANAQDYFDLEDSDQIYRLDRQVKIFLDSTHDLTLNQVSQPGFQDYFRAHDDHLTFGYLESTIWLKLQTRCSSFNDRWYLEIPAPFLEYVDFFQSNGESAWHHSVSGYFRKHSERSFTHTGHVLPLMFGADSLNTTYVRIAGSSPKTFVVNVIEKEKFVQKIRSEDLLYGIFFGILLVMLLYNFYLYLTLRQKNYFLYVLIIALTTAILSAISGYGGKFLWPESPVFNYINGKLALELLIVCITLYTINFLEVRKYSRFMYFMLLALLPLAGVAFLLTSSKAVVSAGNNLVTLSTVIFIAAGVVARIRGNKIATSFIAAWTIYFTGGLLLTLRNSGFLDYNFWTTHFVEIGAILGVTLMGFALGAQYRRLQKEKEAAQQLAYQMQQEDSLKLERKVDERTQQLYQTNNELQKTLETNRKQTKIIENKNAELDSFFHRISHDLKGPVLSSLGLMALAKLDVKDERALEYIEKQHAQLERLMQIITGLVDLTQLSNADLKKERIDFDRMIEDCVGSLDHIPGRSRVTFEKHISDVAFDSEWTLVNAIIQNLIENSIKYARDDAPYVKIEVFEESDCLIIRVEDNGLGIAAEHHAKIFEMFHRATNEADGSGLGLYILKRSVDRLHGTISVKSEVGVGSIFTVKLPLHTDSEEAAH